MKEEVTTIELAWLAGFWDGEGSITIFSHQEKNGNPKISPTLLAVNTHEETIAHVSDILDRLGTSFHILTKKPHSKKHKPAIQISTRNRQYIKTVLEAMLPFLVTKKAQAMLTLRYVNKKIEQGSRPSYDEDDYEIQESVQSLNKRGPLSEPSTTIGEATKK